MKQPEEMKSCDFALHFALLGAFSIELQSQIGRCIQQYSAVNSLIMILSRSPKVNRPQHLEIQLDARSIGDSFSLSCL